MPFSNPDLIHVGRGDIWIDVPVPAEGSLVPLDSQGNPGSGINIGSTLGPALYRYNVTTVDIRTQQSTMVVGYVTNEEDVRMEFEVGELTYENLKRMLLTPKALSGYVAMGGLIVPDTHSFMLVAPRRAGGFIEAMVYKAVAVENREFSFNRAGVMSIKTIVRGQAVTTRSLGDQGGFVAPYIAPSI